MAPIFGNNALVAVATSHLVALEILRRWATLTRTIVSTPAAKSRSILAVPARRRPCRGAPLRASAGSNFYLARPSPKMAWERILRAEFQPSRLWGNLAHQDVSFSLTSRADTNNAALIEVLQGILADVGNIVGDFFRPQLVSRASTSCFQWDRGKPIAPHHRFAHGMASSKLPPFPR